MFLHDHHVLVYNINFVNKIIGIDLFDLSINLNFVKFLKQFMKITYDIIHY
jgi:hypothetical protein